jgi:multidrug efflux pump subunit AcrA (membrane-fusion protein)
MKKFILLSKSSFILIFLSSCMLLPVEAPPLLPPLIGRFERVESRFTFVQRGHIYRDIIANASRIPGREETLSFSVDGLLINHIHVREGSFVRTGDILAVLDKENLAERRDAALYDMSLLEIRLRHTEEVHLMKVKYAHTNVNQAEHERAIAEITNRMRILQIDIDELNEFIAERTLLATMDGEVTFIKSVSQGSMSVADEHFITISDTTFHAFAVRGQNAQYFEIGMPVQMRISGFDFFDTIVADPYIIGVYSPEESTAYFSINYVPEYFHEDLLNARFVSVRLVLEEKYDTLFLPRAALHRSDGQYIVYFLNEDDIAEIVPVTIGMEASARRTEILYGEGDRVVLQGCFSADGNTVRGIAIVRAVEISGSRMGIGLAFDEGHKAFGDALAGYLNLIQVLD